MLAIHENTIDTNRKVSIRYDASSRTYYCFYHRTDRISSELILSYDLREGKWTVETTEYKDIFENKLNDLYHDENIPFEEQLRYVIDHLDTYFSNQTKQQKMNINVIYHRIYSLPWFRRLRDTRRWVSQDVLTEPPTVVQRYSAPEKSTHIDNKEQIVSAKALAESFYPTDVYRKRTKTFTSTLEYPNRHGQTRTPNKAPSISEIWLNVSIQGKDGVRKKLADNIGEDQLKKLAEKFVTYFSGTFQCNVGHEYQLEYDHQIWHFTVLKFEFLTNQISETTKIPKTKLIFLIDGIPHHVRG